MSLAGDRYGRGLAAARRALGLLGRVEFGVAVACFTAAVLLNVVQIALRYLFATSIWWVQEISLLLMLVAYFVGTSCVYRTRQYVIISFVVDRLPLRIQSHLYVLTQLLILGFFALLGWQLIGMLPHMARTRTVILRMPQYYMALPLLYASLSILLTSIYYTLAFARSSRGPGTSLDAIEAPVRVS